MSLDDIVKLITVATSVGGTGIVLFALKYMLDGYEKFKDHVREDLKLLKLDLSGQLKMPVEKIQKLEDQFTKLLIEQVEHRHQSEKNFKEVKLQVNCLALRIHDQYEGDRVGPSDS